MNREFAVIIEGNATEGYSAYIPDLPGCITVGDTMREVLDNMKEAIILHLQGMIEEGIPLPSPSTVTRTIEVPIPSAQPHTPAIIP